MKTNTERIAPELKDVTTRELISASTFLDNYEMFCALIDGRDNLRDMDTTSRIALHASFQGWDNVR